MGAGVLAASKKAPPVPRSRGFRDLGFHCPMKLGTFLEVDVWPGQFACPPIMLLPFSPRCAMIASDSRRRW